MNGLATIVALGFVLGMRHATDPDHVIAVTTIVARQRKAGSAAWIGALWGLGHTLTILAVGGGIILFRWVVPPRIGLSMSSRSG
jgi:high-affinity nickel permease